MNERITRVEKADYVLYKRSNDNMYLNLFLMANHANKNKQIPLTFLPDTTDYYTYGQKVVKITSMAEKPRDVRKKSNSK